MSSWSKRRKNSYLAVVLILVIGVVIIPAFLILYKAPSCSDGMKNGSETGIDCGGSCSRLCASAFIPVNVGWTRFEEVAPGQYNLAAYLRNLNTDGEAVNVPYHMTLYDRDGHLITDVSGKVTIPPHRNTLAFLPAVSTGERVPAKVLFELTAAPDWHTRADPLKVLEIGQKDYSEEGKSSSLQVTIKNASVHPVGSLHVYVVLYDKDANAIGFSKTIIDEIGPQSSAIAPFTWPKSRNGSVISIEVLPVAE